MKNRVIQITLLIFISSLFVVGCSNNSSDNQGEIRVIRDLNNPNSELNKEITQIELADKQIELEKEIDQLKKELDQIKESFKNNSLKQPAPRPGENKTPLPNKKPAAPSKKAPSPDTIIRPNQGKTPGRAIY
jgi:hypothetical protein